MTPALRGEESMPPNTCALIWEEPLTLPAETLRATYYHPETLKPLCTVCENYGRNYACPPLTLDVEAFLKQYPQVHLLAARLQLPRTLPKEMLASLYVNAMAVFNRRLLCYEAAEAGSLAIAPGHCTLCPRCARADGKPCPKPEQVRLSLDAFSLEIARMASELFHFEIQWFNDQPPAYLTLIGGLLSMRAQTLTPLEDRVFSGLEEAVAMPTGV